MFDKAVNAGENLGRKLFFRVPVYWPHPLGRHPKHTHMRNYNYFINVINYFINVIMYARVLKGFTTFFYHPSFPVVTSKYDMFY